MSDHAGQELISVILPVYNGENSIETSVSSVLAQTYGNIELIIVDDASNDNTHDICSHMSRMDNRIRIITNPGNCGVLKARTKGVESAGSGWIAFIDADDSWQPEKLEKQLKLRDTAGCDLVYTGSAFSGENGKEYDWIMHVPERVGFKRLLKQNIISNSSVLMKKEDYLKYAPSGSAANEMHEDFACWLAMLRDGHTACGIDEPLITYRISKGAKTGNKFKASTMNMNTYKYIGLGFWSRIFYQTCYAFNGLLKHRHFR